MRLINFKQFIKNIFKNKKKEYLIKKNYKIKKQFRKLITRDHHRLHYQHIQIHQSEVEISKLESGILD